MSKELIDALGGSRQVAAALGTSPGAVRNWKLPDRSIPWKYRPTIARIAAERAIPLPSDFWEVVAA